MRTIRARHVLPALVILASFGAAACAEAPAPQAPGGSTRSGGYPQSAGLAAPPPPQSTAAPSGAPADELMARAAPRTLPEAVNQLDEAERILGGLLGDPTRPQVERPMSPTWNGGSQAQTDPCQIACLALASMRRSAEHVCSMAGDADPACGSARSRVQRAQERVIASCPACAEAQSPNKSG